MHPIIQMKRNEKTTPEPKIGFMWRWQLQMFFLIYINYQKRLRCANCEMVLLIFLERSEYVRVQIDINVFGLFYFEHFRIWSSALWWLNEICNQPKPLCIRAQFSKLLHFLHIPEERSSKQCTAVAWRTLQELQYFKNDLSLVFSYSWMNLNFAKRKYIWVSFCRAGKMAV